MTPSKLELAYIEEVLETALREFRALEEELEWYTSKVPEQVEVALEIFRGKPSEQ